MDSKYVYRELGFGQTPQFFGNYASIYMDSGGWQSTSQMYDRRTVNLSPDSSAQIRQYFILCLTQRIINERLFFVELQNGEQLCMLTLFSSNVLRCYALILL